LSGFLPSFSRSKEYYSQKDSSFLVDVDVEVDVQEFHLGVPPHTAGAIWCSVILPESSISRPADLDPQNYFQPQVVGRRT
jgi:hypothetical protein